VRAINWRDIVLATSPPGASGSAPIAEGELVSVAVAVTAVNRGYESPSAFITAFKRQFGVTPGRYRSAEL